MKRVLPVVLALVLALSLCAFALADEAAMSYADYIASEIDTEVTLEVCVQACQFPKDGAVSIYAADADGAYFFYGVPATDEQIAALVPGTRIRVTGYKSEWAGEVELSDVSSLEILDGESYVAEAVDVTDILSDNDALAAKMNQYVSFKGLTVEPSTIEGDETEYAFLYNWDGSGEQGDDLYFNASKDGATYSFVIENALFTPEDAPYATVESLKVGDVIDMEGFLYWYNGPNPHICVVTKAE